MTSLVWLFKEHRDLVLKLAQAEASASILTEKFIRAEEDNKKLVETLAKMQDYVTQVVDKSPLDLFERYQQQVLQDQPYVDGVVPDTEWLTPGEPESVRDEVNA